MRAFTHSISGTPRILPFLGILMVITQRLAADDTDAELANFEVMFSGEHAGPLVVEIGISGNGYRFQVDTGSARTAFDLRLRDRLFRAGGKSGYIDIAGPHIESRFRSPPLTIGAVQIPALSPVLCLDLSHLRASDGTRIDGVLGVDALRTCCMRLDFECGKLSFLKYAPTDAGTEVRFVQKSAFPVIDAILGGCGRRQFLLDTGFNGEACISHRDFNALLQRREIVPAGTVAATSFSARYHLRLGVLAVPLRQAGHSHCPLVLGEFPASSTPRSILGMEYLSRFVVTIDFPNRSAYFKKAKSFRTLRPAADLIGVQLARVDGRFIVDSVRQGDRTTPHARIGDILESIDEISAMDLTDVEVVKRLSDRAKDVRLVFRNASTNKSWWMRLPPSARP